MFEQKLVVMKNLVKSGNSEIFNKVKYLIIGKNMD